MRDYLELTKPRITWLILMSTGIGYFFGMRGSWNLWSLFHTVLGTGLIASGTAALNQWYEREADRKMRRTSDRPLPSGRLSAPRALAFGIALSIAGFADLWLGCNLLAAVLGALTLGSYLFLYTPLKQRTPFSTTVGAFPGAMPPMIGFVATHGSITAEAWVLFAILFLWQFPHFYSIAWMYREDYARAGFKVMPVVDPGGRVTACQIALHCFAVVPASLMPAWCGLAGKGYGGAALLLGAVYLALGMRASWTLAPLDARRLFFASLVYLPVLFGMLALGGA
jgi:protoheme IX farnesyltransferase